MVNLRPEMEMVTVTAMTKARDGPHFTKMVQISAAGLEFNKETPAATLTNFEYLRWQI